MEKRNKLAVNRHHMLWERKSYHGKDKALRQLGGFVVPTTMYTHQLLHAQMRPPVKPFARLRNDIIDYTTSLELPQDRFEIPNQVADWLDEQGETHHSNEYAYRSSRLADHLRTQIGYMALEDIE